MRSKRGVSIHEVTFATALAGLLIGVHCGEISRQQVDMALVRGEAQARDELLNAYERLRAGLIAPPPAGPAASIAATPRVSLEIQRLPTPPSLPSAVFPVRLRATWRDPDGNDRRRELVTLVSKGGDE